ncbi:MAG: molybdopterin-binding protein, partial [Paracoccaceae bacterium]|nr:molybdopterin-binding protein [Paracoccaceae bacterium]
MPKFDETKPFVPVRIAVLTVSDSRSLADDRSGQVLVDRIEAAGHVVAHHDIMPDERNDIAEKLRVWCADKDVDVVITTGGTGLTGRDVSVEAHRDVYEKE